MSRESFLPVRSLGQVSIILCGLTAVMTAVLAGIRWHLASVASDVVDETATLDDFQQAAAATGLSYIVFALLLLSSGAVFAVWMYRARVNSDRVTSTHQHQWTRMWTWVAWLVPLANLWVPFVVMQDIWRGSDRSQPMVGLQQRAKSGLITAWWLTFVAFLFVTYLGNYLLGGDSLTLANVQDSAVWATIGALLAITAAWLAARVITRLGDVQHAPEPATA